MRALLFVALVVLAPGASAQADAAPALGDVVARASRGATEYLALAAGGVAVVDGTDEAHPRVLGTLLPGVAVSALLVDGETLWVVVLREGVQSFSLQDPAAPVALLPSGSAASHPPMTAVLPAATPTAEGVGTAPAPGAEAPGLLPPPAGVPTAPPAPAPSGRVVEVKSGRVIFEVGGGLPVQPGMRVQVIAQRLVAKPDLKGGGTIERPSGERTAVVEVEEVEGGRAMALLGRGDVAAAGDLVAITDAPRSERLWLPRRAGFTWRTGFMARPFLSLGDIGGGALVDGFVRYTFADLPLTLGAEVTPLALNITGRQSVGFGGVAASAAFTTDFFEVGLGVGGLGAIATGLSGDPYGRLSINQELRLGAIDGLHLAWRSGVYVEPMARGVAASGGFQLGMGRGELNLPVTSRLSIFAAGAFGLPGYGFGELGVRSMFMGTGAPGTLILTTSLGGTGVGTSGGPAVSFGMEWRL